LLVAPGNKKDMQARFPAGTFKRIAAVFKEREDRTDFVPPNS
jgi:hypothetical protein